jgi:tRNA-2-methylthio-N6-dimethylallyladenosine synthase
MEFFIRTFGCQMNKADSEVAAGTLTGAGHIESPEPPETGLVVINTCSVRENAVERLYGYVNSLKPKSKAGSAPILAIGGCVAELKGADIFSELPQTDIVFGTRAFHLLPDAIERIEAGDKEIDLTGVDGDLPKHPTVRPEDPARAWLPISRGCDNFCSYCVVPFARGRETSRPMAEVLEEAVLMAKRGVREITLLGQNVNSYGNDLGQKDAFADLLYGLNATDGIERIRFMTSHPKDLSETTIQAVAAGDKICEHVHLPLQSGSDRILKEMNRKYNLNDYMARVNALRNAIPRAAITTDIIVGFPGETEDDFGATLSAVREIGYDAAFTFIYSPREGTAAAKMKDEMPWAAKEARLRRLIELQAQKSLDANREYLGCEIEVFVENPSRKGENRWAGRTRTNKIVNFSSPIDLKNRFVNVLIEEATPASLAGTLCGPIE